MAQKSFQCNTRIFKLKMIDYPNRQWLIARKAGIHEGAFSKIVNGHRATTKQKALKITKELGADFNDLFSETVPQGK